MGRRGKCIHGCGREMDRGKRRLCRVCYYTLEVRELYPCRKQSVWLKRDLVRLEKLREKGTPIPECAAIFGRSEYSVRSAIKRNKLTLTTHNYCFRKVAKLVRQLHRLGWSDRLMALELGKSEGRVKAYRLRLGLPKNSREEDDYCTCIGCPRAKPPWARSTGWQSRKVDGMPDHVMDWICPTCLKEHGWGGE